MLHHGASNLIAGHTWGLVHVAGKVMHFSIDAPELELLHRLLEKHDVPLKNNNLNVEAFVDQMALPQHPNTAAHRSYSQVLVVRVTALNPTRTGPTSTLVVAMLVAPLGANTVLTRGKPNFVASLVSWLQESLRCHVAQTTRRIAPPLLEAVADLWIRDYMEEKHAALEVQNDRFLDITFRLQNDVCDDQISRARIEVSWEQMKLLSNVIQKSQTKTHSYIDCVKTQFSRDMKIDLRIFHLEKILVGGIMLGVNGKLKLFHEDLAGVALDTLCNAIG